MLSPRIGALTCALLACGAGCHPRPGPHGSTFTRVATPHFTVYTDVSPRQAEQHATKLEWLLQGLLDNGWEYHGELPLKLNVVLLRDPAELEEFAGFDFSGYFRSDVLYEPWAVLSAPLLADELPTLVHELSHHLAYLALQNQPVWFAEGLAEYYESATIQGDRFLLGLPRQVTYSVLVGEGILPSVKLFDPALELTPRAYASAWLLVHYLMTRRPDAFVRYQDELARGASHERAWAAAFPDLQEQALDQTLHEYLLRGSYQAIDAPFQPAAVSTYVRPLTYADEEALRAVLWYTCSRCDATERARKAREHVQRALALDTRHVEARLLSSLLAGADSERIALLTAVTRDAPEDYRGWLGLASLQQGAEARTAVDSAIALAPQQPSAWMARARYEWNTGERAAALKSAQRALRLRPTSLPLLVGYAEMLSLEGRCSEMHEILRRASGLENAKLDAAGTSRLNQIASSCQAGARR